LKVSNRNENGSLSSGNSNKHSAISNDSFDSVKKINKEDEMVELDEVSAKLMARIKKMKDAKKETLRPKLSKTYTDRSYDFSCVSPSPISSRDINLPTVNEQDEIKHRKCMKHKRAHSIPNDLRSSEKKKAEINEYVSEHKLKEFNILTAFKVGESCN
jgi:hypothetical protein